MSLADTSMEWKVRPGEVRVGKYFAFYKCFCPAFLTIDTLVLRRISADSMCFAWCIVTNKENICKT